MCPELDINKSKEESKEEIVLSGLAVSGGIAQGVACVYHSLGKVPRYTIEESEIASEFKRLQVAREETREELEEIIERVTKEIGVSEGAIFRSHLAVLDDPYFISESTNRLHNQHLNVEAIVEDVIGKMAQMLSMLEDTYLRERAEDMHDVGKRILEKLLLHEQSCQLLGTSKGIIVAKRLLPSITVHLDKDKVVGFMTEAGGITSHASIIARSMGIPAIVGIHNVVSRLKGGEWILIDGYAGKVIINPTQETIEKYQKLEQKFHKQQLVLEALSQKSPITLDGIKIALHSNLASTNEVEMVRKFTQDGIGLFRSEYLFIADESMPDEETQYQNYLTVAEAIAPQKVIIRTLDLGGDKLLPGQTLPDELNPFLGWRAIRISLELVDTFRIQLRAILRASVHKNIQAMIPMISSLEEVIRTKEIWEEEKAKLTLAGIPYDINCPLGIMIEIPSAVLLAPYLIEEVDFFSIGTNDLTQYFLAVDRNNEKVAPYYEHFNPAVLQAIYQTIQVANKAGKSIGLCGEIAGDPDFTILLLGMGLREFSMSPVLIPDVKKIVRSVKISEAEEIAQAVLKMRLVKDIKLFLKTKTLEILERNQIAEIGN